MSKPRITIELEASDSFCHTEPSDSAKCQFAYQLDNGTEGGGSWFCQFFGVLLKKDADGKLKRDQQCTDAEKKFLRSLPSNLELKADEIVPKTER